jgi:hypothetical protein
MARRNKPIDLPAPYLKRVWLEPSRITDRAAYPSPTLMACPGVRLLRLTKYGLEPVTVKETDHYRVMREFCDDPKGFVEAALAE